MGREHWQVPPPYHAILNIRFGTLEVFDVWFFKDKESCVDFLMDLPDNEKK